MYIYMSVYVYVDMYQYLHTRRMWHEVNFLVAFNGFE